MFSHVFERKGVWSAVVQHRWVGSGVTRQDFAARLCGEDVVGARHLQSRMAGVRKFALRNVEIWGAGGKFKAWKQGCEHDDVVASATGVRNR